MRYFIFLLILIFPSFSNAETSNTSSLEILHTNDIHGVLFPIEYSSFPGIPKPKMGGFSRAYAYIKKQREKIGKKNLLLLDAGDFFHGTPEGDYSFGKSIVNTSTGVPEFILKLASSYISDFFSVRSTKVPLPYQINLVESFTCKTSTPT